MERGWDRVGIEWGCGDGRWRDGVGWVGCYACVRMNDLSVMCVRDDLPRHFSLKWKDGCSFWRAWSIRLIVLSPLSPCVLCVRVCANALPLSLSFTQRPHLLSSFASTLIMSCCRCPCVGQCHSAGIHTFSSALLFRRCPLTFAPRFLFSFFPRGCGVSDGHCSTVQWRERVRQRVANDPIVSSFLPTLFPCSIHEHPRNYAATHTHIHSLVSFCCCSYHTISSLVTW